MQNPQLTCGSRQRDFQMELLRITAYTLCWSSVPSFLYKGGPNVLFSVFHLYWFLLLPIATTSSSTLLMCDSNAAKNCPNILPETFRVSLHCRWVNCVKIFNPINHDDGLIRINVLILTALI